MMIQELHDATRETLGNFLYNHFKTTPVSQNMIALFTHIARRRY